MVQATTTQGALAYLNTLDVSYLRGIPGLCGFRLSLESGVAASSSDQAAKTTLYLTPCNWAPMCGVISCYESSAWVPRVAAEASISLSGLTASLPHDLFAYFSSGTLTLDLAAWTNTTTRATALATQSGVYVKSGATSRTYVGTICTTSSTGQCEDSLARRLIWSNYNRIPRRLFKGDTTDTWTYSSATVRSSNNSTANRVETVVGNVCEPHLLKVHQRVAPGSAVVATIGVGLDSTTAFSAPAAALVGTTNGTIMAVYEGVPSAGYHYFQALESSSGGTTTFVGDNGTTVEQGGIYGLVWC